MAIPTHKPFKGTFTNWKIMQDLYRPKDTYLVGLFVDHPQFAEKHGYTSNIVELNEEEGWVETRNSIYKLGEKAE